MTQYKEIECITCGTKKTVISYVASFKKYCSEGCRPSRAYVSVAKKKEETFPQMRCERCDTIFQLDFNPIKNTLLGLLCPSCNKSPQNFEW